MASGRGSSPDHPQASQPAAQWSESSKQEPQHRQLQGSAAQSSPMAEDAGGGGAGGDKMQDCATHARYATTNKIVPPRHAKVPHGTEGQQDSFHRRGHGAKARAPPIES